MDQTYQICIIRKNNQTLTLISPAPMKDVYAMLHSAVSAVAKMSNQSIDATLGVLADLDRFAKSSGQGSEGNLR